MIQTIANCTSFLTSSQVYHTLVGLDGYYISANLAFLKTYDINEAELPTIRSTENIHPDDREKLLDVYKKCIENPGTFFCMEARNVLCKPNHISTRWEIVLQQETEGLEPHFYCIGFDSNNENKYVEAPLKNGQISLTGSKAIEEVLSNSVDVVFIADINGIISFCSQNVKKEMGFEPGEMTGKSGFDFVHPDDLADALKAFENEALYPNTNNSVDLRYRGKDGSWIWFETKGKNLMNHPLVNGMMINLNNINTRKKAEEALKESETEYRSFYETLPYPLFIINPDTGIIACCNNSSVAKYGYSLPELQQMTLIDLFDEKPDAAQLNDMYQQKATVRHRTKNGNLIFVKLEQYNLRFANRDCHLVIAQDVTDSYNRQQEGQFVFEISSILMQNEAFEPVLKKALQKLRIFTGWDLIELWTPAYDHSFIRNAGSDYSATHPLSKNIEKFVLQSCSKQYSKENYSNTPVYKTAKTHWIEDLNIETTLVRNKQAVEAGFVSALAVPLINEGIIVASIYLFSCNKKEKNPYAEKLIVTLGSLIGTEIEKRKRELELDLFFRVSSDCMTIAGLDGRYLKANPAFEKFIGYTQEEAKEFHPLHFVYEEDRKGVLQKLEYLSKGVPVNCFETRVKTRKGDIKWISWSATPSFEEGMVIATHRDITEQKLFEEQLKLSNERYELATKATSIEAIWDYDLKTHKTTWSELFTTMFGYSTLHEDNNLFFWGNQIHPDDRDRVISSFSNFLEQDESSEWYCEYRFKKSDGTYANIIDRGHMIFDASGVPIRVVGTMEDDTERKKMEQELLLKERIKHKQIAQVAVNAQERERAEIGKELHDNVSQVLSSTKLYMDILQNKIADPLLEQSIKNINTIIKEVRNISHSLIPYSIEDLGLIATINDYHESSQLPNIDVEFYPDFEVENLINTNHKLTLYRIFQEQINNVIKHADASKVVIELFAQNNAVELIITDNGQGFDINTVKKGSGLKNINSRSELLNGSSEIITSPGQGCKLKVNIPY
jgi:PAS domain S-box-containing protein